jgi:hypothetical protein
MPYFCWSLSREAMGSAAQVAGAEGEDGDGLAAPFAGPGSTDPGAILGDASDAIPSSCAPVEAE